MFSSPLCVSPLPILLPFFLGHLLLQLFDIPLQLLILLAQHSAQFFARALFAAQPILQLLLVLLVQLQVLGQLFSLRLGLGILLTEPAIRKFS